MSFKERTVGVYIKFKGDVSILNLVSSKFSEHNLMR